MMQTPILLLCLATPLAAQEAKKDYCTEEEAKAHIAACKKDSKLKTDDDVKSFIDKLSEKKHPLILKQVETFLGRGSVDVQQAAAEEIGTYAREAKASEALLNAVKGAAARKETFELAQAILKQVGKVAHRPHARMLLGYFEHKDIEGIATQAIKSCGKLKSKDTVDPLIKMLDTIDAIKATDDTAPAPPGGGIGGPGGPAPQDEEKAKKKKLADPIIDALAEITGETKRTAKEWKDYWAKTRNSFKELPIE